MTPSALRNATFVEIALQTSMSNIHFSFYWKAEEDIESFDRLKKFLDEMKERASEVAWTMVVRVSSLLRPDRRSFAEKVKLTANEIFRARMATSLGVRLVDVYVNKKDKAEAYFLAEMIELVSPKLRSRDSNNLGYLALTKDDLDTALRLLEHAASAEDLEDDVLLCSYNLGVARARKADKEGAIKSFQNCVDASAVDEGAGCLHVIDTASSILKVTETFEITSIRACAEKNLAWLSKLENTHHV